MLYEGKEGIRPCVCQKVKPAWAAKSLFVSLSSKKIHVLKFAWKATICKPKSLHGVRNWSMQSEDRRGEAPSHVAFKESASGI